VGAAEGAIEPAADAWAFADAPDECAGEAASEAENVRPHATTRVTVSGRILNTMTLDPVG
jgi:hypothetical protein